MSRLKFSQLIKIIFSSFCLLLLIACGSQRHSMQYLINRSYLQDVGLSKSVVMLDMKGTEKVRAIHIGTPDDIIVPNFMVFNNYGDLVSVSKEKGENTILKLVEFKYDKVGRLEWIVPHQNYFGRVGYDSLKVEHKGGKPSKTVAMKNGQTLWIENISFDENTETYSFVKDEDDQNDRQYTIYQFDNRKIMNEYHRSRLSDNNIDSTKYYYVDYRLQRKSEIFNGSMLHVLKYDQLERPESGTTMFYRKDSVAWVDKYYYLMDEKLPHSIVTTSPMGWREETNFYWEIQE